MSNNAIGASSHLGPAPTQTPPRRRAQSRTAVRHLHLSLVHSLDSSCQETLGRLALPWAWGISHLLSITTLQCHESVHVAPSRVPGAAAAARAFST